LFVTFQPETYSPGLIRSRQLEDFEVRRLHMARSNIAICAAIAIVFSGQASAYIGPGAGLGAIGTAIALVGALVLLVAGFVWYPIKRIIRGRTPARASGDEVTSGSEGDESPNEEDETCSDNGKNYH
jgi:hypothetical protein